MGHFYREIRIPIGVATNELVEFILAHPFSEMSLSDLKICVRQQRDNHQSITGNASTKPMPTTSLELMKELQSHTAHILTFSTDSSSKDDHWQEPLCTELRARNIPYQYYADYEEYNNDVSLWTPKGSVTYDVDVESAPIVSYDKIAEIMNEPTTDTVKVIRLEELLKVSSPYGLPTLESYSVQKVDELSAVDKILERFDNGEISKDEAFKEIADCKAEKGA